MPQLLLQGTGDERTLVLVSEDLANGLAGDTLGNAPGLQLANDAQPSAAFDLGGGAGIGCGELLVVEAAGFEESRDGGVDVVSPCSRSRRRSRHSLTDNARRDSMCSASMYGGRAVISHQTG